jgi:hypothetical protein
MEKSQFHPLAQQIADHMEANAEGLWILPEASACEAEAKLAELRGKPELRWAVRSLLGLAFMIDSTGSREGAQSLVRVAATADAALVELGPEALDEPTLSALSGMISADFSQFKGDRSQQAPHVGDRPPEGSVLAASLMPRRRL